MKLIKHLINVAFLWSLPYASLLFFWLLTLCQFSYAAAITSTVWAVVVFFYSLMALILYGVSVDTEDEITLFSK